MKNAEEIAEEYEFNYCQPSGLEPRQAEGLLKLLDAHADEVWNEAIEKAENIAETSCGLSGCDCSALIHSLKREAK